MFIKSYSFFFILIYLSKKKKFSYIKQRKDDDLRTIKILGKENLFFNIIQLVSYLSPKSNYSKFSYQIQIVDSLYNQISPSDLTLYYKLHIVCFLIVNNTINIVSLAQVIDDKYFKCIEFSYLNENFKIGFILYETKDNGFIKDDYVLYSIDKSLFKYNLEDDDVFDFSKIWNNYKLTWHKLKDDKNSKGINKIKKLYISKPRCNLKRHVASEDNQWNFFNIFNEYFCFCKGLNCLSQIISKSCKYYFYLYIIDNNRKVYKKTDFLLMDFILKQYSSDDVYPIFEEMVIQNLNAHYLTEKQEIYEKYCFKKKYCDSVILANNKSYKIDDEFLESHLTLILKLKKVISSVGVNINFINNIFYDIDYITYICVGHGISYFKYYLYKEYYGPTNFDKLLIPNSDKLISVVLKYGWKDEDLIKMNLPRWEKYNIKELAFINGNIKANSIFIMFTWREIKRNRKISRYYIKNIIKLLNKKLLINNLIKHNITLYFTLHHRLFNYRNDFMKINNIKYIEENDIAECLLKTNLVVTDYSSIVFDMIYRMKPYIIYIPDGKDSFIKQNYLDFCYKIIKNFKSNDFRFENVYFDIKSTINKINYYIDNDFKLDTKLREFYEEFNFTRAPIINEFIDYLLKDDKNN